MNKKDRGSTGTFARRLIDDVKALLLITSKASCALRTRNATCAKPPRPPFFSISFCTGEAAFKGSRSWTQVRAATDLQQHFPHLVGAQHIFTMNLR